MMTTKAISLREKGFAIIALGDFNARVGKIPGLEGNNDTRNSFTGLFHSFIDTLNLTILNTLPIAKGLFTHFVEKQGLRYSESVLDYGLCDPSLTPFINSFVIDADARFSCGSDHALLLTEVSFGQEPVLKHSFSDVQKFKLPPNGDYQSLI